MAAWERGTDQSEKTYTRRACRRLPHSNLDSNSRLGQQPCGTGLGKWSRLLRSESYTINTPLHLEV